MREEENLPELTNLFLLSSCCYCKLKVDRTHDDDRLYLVEWSLLPLSVGHFQSLNFLHFDSSQLNEREFQQRVHVTLSFSFDPQTVA